MTRRLPGWLAAVAARLARRPSRAPARRLAAEELEAREVPATFTWVPTGPGAYSWTDPANWTGGTPGGFPNAAGDVAVVTGSPTGNQLINLNAAITVGELDVASSGTAGTYTIAANGAGFGLTFDATTGSAFLTSAGDGGADAVLAPITLADDLVLSGGGAAPLGLAGDIGAATARTVSVVGTVRLLDSATLGASVVVIGMGTVSPTPVTFATSFYDGALYAFAADTGETLATLVAPNAGTLLLPAGLTVGPDGDLYVSNQGDQSLNGVPGNNSIVKYDLDTFAVSTFVSSAELQLIVSPSTQNFAPTGLRFGPDGDLYVSANRGFGSPDPGAVYRLDITAGIYAGTSTLIAAAQTLPAGLTFGTAAGDETTLYIAGFGGVTRVTTATTTPGAATPFIAPGTGGLETSVALTFGPDGDIFVADLGAFTDAGKILRYNPDGSFDSVFVAAGTGATLGDLFQQFPSDLYFDPQSRLVVVNLGPDGPTTGHPNDFDGAVYRYTAAGAFDQVLVSSAAFPSTGATAAFSGVVPSQAARVGAAALTVAGRVSPAGDFAVGTLTVPDLTLLPGATYTFELAAGGNDRIASTGAVTLTGATPSFRAVGGFAAPVGSVYTIVSAASVVGTFSGLANNAVFSNAGLEFRVNYTATAVTLTRILSPDVTSPGTATFYTGASNTFTVTATGSPTITYTLGGDPLPTGLTFDGNTGLLSGTPTATATLNLTVTATSSTVGTTPATEPLVLTILAGVAPDITTANSAVFVQGVGGTFDVDATGDPAPAFGATGLPAGVSIDPGTGLVTVAATTANGVYSLTIVASNGVTPDDSQTFTLTVGTVPEVTSGGAATFYTGTGNNFTVTADGFPTPALSFDALPAGLSFDPGTGVLSGTPTVAPGDYTIQFTATNAVGSDTEALTLTVLAGVAPDITTADNAAFVQGVGGTFDVNATAAPATVTFSATGLPTGASIDPATGIITVDTTVASGVYTLTIGATNGVTPDDSQTFTLTVGTVPEVTSGGSATFFTGAIASFPLTATGSPTPTLMVTGTLPTGVTFNTTTNTLEGIPTQSGTFNVTVTATSAVGSDAEPLVITVQVGVAPNITTANTLLVGPAGGTLDVNATGNPAPTFSVTGAPAGVTIDATTGVLSVPAALAANTYTFDITATNPLGGFTQTFALTVGTAPAFTSATSTTFTAGLMGGFTVTATGSPAPMFAFTAGTLPPGITLSPSGTLGGTATQVGTFNATFTASNGVTPNATQQFTLTIGQGPAITSANAASVARGGSFTVTATGTPAPTFGVTGAPAGVTIDPTTGVLSVGAATATGLYSLTLTATNAVGGANQTFALNVPGGPVVVPGDEPTRLAASGRTGGGAALFDPNAAGTYATTPTATVNPFSGLGVLVRSAVGDVNGDGVDDTIVVTGPGTPVRFAVVSGVDNSSVLVPSTAAFAGSEDFTGGAFVSTGDLDGDGRDDVVLSPDQGGGARVTVFRLPAGGTLTVAANFLGIDDPNFRGGARTAVGDVNADGTPDVAVAAGFLGGPRVALFNGATLFTTRAKLVNDFFAFPGSDAITLRNGAYVAVGDVTGDGFGDLIFGGGPGGAPRVFVLSGATVTANNVAGAQAAPVANFFVANNAADRGGARVGVVDADNDGRADIAVGSGPGLPARVRVYLAPTVTANGEPAPFQDLFPFTGEVLTDGVYVS